MRKILSFVVRNNSYNNARKIADCIIIALTKYSSSVPKPTFTSEIKLTMYERFTRDLSRITDESLGDYKITVFKCIGNRKSLLSPAYNEIYDNIIACRELIEILDILESSEKEDS